MVAAAAVFLLAGCGGGGEQVAEPTATPPEAIATEAVPTAAPSACEAAVASAAQVDPVQDINEDLWAAFDACASLEEFQTAAEAHPGALDGADPETYVRNGCQYYPEVADSQLCQAIG